MWLTVSKAAKYANVQRATIYAWISRGKLTPLRVGDEVFPLYFVGQIDECVKTMRKLKK